MRIAKYRKLVATKLDEATYSKLIEKCSKIECNPAEYIRALVNVDIWGESYGSESRRTNEDDERKPKGSVIRIIA